MKKKHKKQKKTGEPGEPGGTRGNPGEPGETRQKKHRKINGGTLRGTGGSAPLDLILKSFRLEPLQAEPGLGKNGPVHKNRFLVDFWNPSGSLGDPTIFHFFIFLFFLFLGFPQTRLRL